MPKAAALLSECRLGAASSSCGPMVRIEYGRRDQPSSVWLPAEFQYLPAVLLDDPTIGSVQNANEMAYQDCQTAIALDLSVDHVESLDWRPFTYPLPERIMPDHIRHVRGHEPRVFGPMREPVVEVVAGDVRQGLLEDIDNGIDVGLRELAVCHLGPFVTGPAFEDRIEENDA